ncbi:MAG: PEP-CTERM sorting domain-containing protein [Sedimentisphaerales bacterium]
MGKIAAISSLVVLLVITGADAAIVELPLACEGRYDVNSGSWEMDFDLGVTFTDISHVYIDWSGEITAGLAFDHTRPGPQPFPEDIGLSAWLVSASFWRHTNVYGGAALYPEPEVFDFKSEFEVGSMPWSELFDGQGTIMIGYTQLVGPYLTYVEFGFVDLSSATLVVEGTPVPEPATIIFLVLGVLGLCTGRRKH